MSFSSFRGASWPRGQTCISWVSCIASGFFTCWAIRKETYFVLVSVKECSSSSFFKFIFYLKDVFFSIFSLTVIIIFLYLWCDRQIISIHSFPAPPQLSFFQQTFFQLWMNNLSSASWFYTYWRVPFNLLNDAFILMGLPSGRG